MTDDRKSGTFEKPMATAQGLAMLLAMLVLFAAAAYFLYARALVPGLGLPS